MNRRIGMTYPNAKWLLTAALTLFSAGWVSAASQAGSALEEIERSFSTLPPAEQQELLQQLQQTQERLRAQATTKPSNDDGAVTAAVASAKAKGSDEDGSPTIWDRIKVRQSVYEKSKFSKPARLTYISPDESDDSYAIDIGITFTAWEGEKWFFGPKLEYHRNTLIEKHGIRGRNTD